MRYNSTWLSLLLFLVLSASSCSSGDDMKGRTLIYKNFEFGFTLSFPEKWGSYRVYDSKEYMDSELKVRVLYFCLPTRSRDWQPVIVPAPYAAVFSIFVFGTAQWQRYSAKNPESVKDDILLGRSEKYVFILRYPSNLPIDLYQYMKEIDALSKSFMLNK